MVAFDKDNALFNYRVAGVAIHDGKILLDRNSRNSYWVLPGGHPEMMESMRDALVREIKEEIDEDVEIIRMIWVVENFFHKRQDIHELSFYFLIQLCPESRLLQSDGPFYGEEHDSRLTFQWYPLDETALDNLPLYPSFLSQALVNLPNTTQHIVFRDPTRKKKKEGSSTKVDNLQSIP
jgi:ADP-ribose pyrophosphatase YjhB (NUDIX family)